MSGKNLKYVANKLSQNYLTGQDFFCWLNAGIRAIVLHGKPAATAFDFAQGIIGMEPDSWRNELCFIANQLGSKLPHFQQGLAECIRQIEPDREANNPGRDRGRNTEKLALTFLAIARELKVAAILQLIPGLIQVKFPKSQAIYDASLLTWRIMASYDTVTNWIAVFCRPMEFRYRPQYSSLLAFGMCVANPSKSAWYLREWKMLRIYFELLTEDSSERNISLLRQLVDAIDEVRGNQASSSFSSVELVSDLVGGRPIELTRRLYQSEQSARGERGPLPTRNVQTPTQFYCEFPNSTNTGIEK